MNQWPNIARDKKNFAAMYRLCYCLTVMADLFGQENTFLSCGFLKLRFISNHIIYIFMECGVLLYNLTVHDGAVIYFISL